MSARSISSSRDPRSSVAKGRETEDAERLSLLLWAAPHGVISLQINKPTLRWPKPTALVEELMRALIRPGAGAG